MPDEQSLKEVPILPPHVRLTGAKRAHFISAAARAYDGENSIAAIADHCGRSASFVHTVLGEAKVEFRRRGSGTRRADNHPRT
ncbi:helix-turn-helix domain-containing protein [Streptomyces sp. NPDC093589]|uniref:helix-turn-helix domain-containing protein n=1 Tax=Streptomyces sp. NPDC093589 TaxID=3366043 RepID=UPI0037F9C455